MAEAIEISFPHIVLEEVSDFLVLSAEKRRAR